MRRALFTRGSSLCTGLAHPLPCVLEGEAGEAGDSVTLVRDETGSGSGVGQEDVATADASWESRSRGV